MDIPRFCWEKLGANRLTFRRETVLVRFTLHDIGRSF